MNRTALYTVLDGYLSALNDKAPDRVPWADGARTSENNVMLDVGDGLWGTIERIGDYDLRLCDEAEGQVGYFGTVHEAGVVSAYALRLKVTDDGAVEEAETIVVRQQDSGIKFDNPRYWDKPILNATAINPGSRAEMIALADGYFDTMQLNDGTLHTRFHPECNRVENGVQTTRNPDVAHIVPVAAQGPEEQFAAGNYRYDDRLRGRRYPLVDEERGIVMAFGFIDHCGVLEKYQLTDGTWVNAPVRYPHSFYLAELFRMEERSIRQVEAHFITVPYHMKSCWDGK